MDIISIDDIWGKEVTDPLKKIMSQKITDIVEVTDVELHKFNDWFDKFIWKDDIDNDSDTDASLIDIYLSNTIPIRDMQVNFIAPIGIMNGRIHVGNNVVIMKCEQSIDTEWNVDFDKAEYITTCPFSEMYEYLMMNDRYFALAGTMSLEDSMHVAVTYPFAISYGSKRIRLVDYALEFKSYGKNRLTDDATDLLDGLLVEMLMQMLGNITQVFSQINLVLLNPVLKEVLASDTTKVPIDISKNNKRNNKPNKRATIRYVKKIYLRNIEEKCKLRGINRHTQLWYVTGHWRQYKSGKRIFVQGYWKGALRETKNGEARSRQLVLPEPIEED